MRHQVLIYSFILFMYLSYIEYEMGILFIVL